MHRTTSRIITLLAVLCLLAQFFLASCSSDMDASKQETVQEAPEAEETAPGAAPMEEERNISVEDEELERDAMQ